MAGTSDPCSLFCNIHLPLSGGPLVCLVSPRVGKHHQQVPRWVLSTIYHTRALTTEGLGTAFLLKQPKAILKDHVILFNHTEFISSKAFSS